MDSSSSAESYDSSRSSIATYLADHYGLVEPVDVRELVRGANRNYLVTSQDQRYVYRVYTDHDFYVRNPEAYQYELDLLAYFKENNLAVPEPVNRLDGQRLSVMVDSTGSQHGSSSVPLSDPATGPHASARCGALFRFFEGEEHVTWHPEVNEQVVISFGGAVAEIHQRADQFQKPYCRHHFDLLYLLDGPLHTLESILKERRGEDLPFSGTMPTTCAGRSADLARVRRSTVSSTPIYTLVTSCTIPMTDTASWILTSVRSAGGRMTWRPSSTTSWRRSPII